MGRLGRAVRQGSRWPSMATTTPTASPPPPLLHQFLREAGPHCFPYIPDRLTQGYGLERAGLQELAKKVRLMVTVDCGISDAEEVAWAKAQGLELIITDHHEPLELPEALAVVNPNEGATPTLWRPAGVGVALLLAWGSSGTPAEGWFRQRPEPNLRSYLDLVALGTAANVVPLVGKTASWRVRAQGPGGKPPARDHRLKEVAQLEGKPISYQDVVFRLAPRLNAAGRMGQARCALELLLSDDLAQARVQARYLHNLNRQRQALEEEG